jgi:hypothetical protein
MLLKLSEELIKKKEDRCQMALFTTFFFEFVSGTDFREPISVFLGKQLLWV